VDCAEGLDGGLGKLDSSISGENPRRVSEYPVS